MDRTSFRVAALVATALFAIACSDARADTVDTASDPAQATTEVETSAQETSSEESSQGGGAVTTLSEDSSILSTTLDPPPPPETLQLNPSPPAPPTTPTTTAPATPPASPPASQGGAGDPPPQRLNETPAAASEPAADQASAVASQASSNDPSTEQAPAPVATSQVPPATPVKSATLGEISRAHAATPPGDTLEQLLSEVGRRLHHVQGKIDDLRHRLAHGAPPPTKRLIDLRASLVRIAPMLAALEASLDAAGRLSPHLRQLLHRVSGDLRGARVTADGLITALRHSGARGPEVRLLLQELEHFRTLDLALPSSPAVASAPAPSLAVANPGFVAVQPAPVVSPPPPSAGAPDRGAGGPQPSESRGGRGSEEPPPSPSSPAPGSATASPGGTFLFAAVASLTMLLIGLLLPALRARLDLPPGRRYNVAFLAPLERPG
jgi:hypothetical protein